MRVCRSATSPETLASMSARSFAAAAATALSAAICKRRRRSCIVAREQCPYAEGGQQGEAHSLDCGSDDMQQL